MKSQGFIRFFNLFKKFCWFNFYFMLNSFTNRLFLIKCPIKLSVVSKWIFTWFVVVSFVYPFFFDIFSKITFIMIFDFPIFNFFQFLVSFDFLHFKRRKLLGNAFLFFSYYWPPGALRLAPWSFFSNFLFDKIVFSIIFFQIYL